MSSLQHITVLDGDTIIAIREYPPGRLIRVDSQFCTPELAAKSYSIMKEKRLSGKTVTEYLEELYVETDMIHERHSREIQIPSVVVLSARS